MLFGRAARGEPDPDDIDLAVRFEPSAEHDILGLLEDLHRLTGGERFDVMDLSLAGPVARERAMLKGSPLFEAEPHLAANEQVAATMLRTDSEWLRRLQLETLAR